MSAEEILITHDGYTDTQYATCGMPVCTIFVLKKVGVTDKQLEEQHWMGGDYDLGENTTLSVGSLGESDSCEYCAHCGDFIRHGLRYPGEDVGCTHKVDEWGNVIDPEPLDTPHIDFR